MLTIKRRLFLSNILMLAMPIILTIFMFTCAAFILASVTGIRDVQSFRDGNIFYGAMKQTDALSSSIDPSDFYSVQSNMDRFNEDYKSFGISLAVYEGDTLVYPRSVSTSGLSQNALSQDSGLLIIEGSDAAYSIHVGGYVFLLSSTDFSFNLGGPPDGYIYIGMLLFAFSIIIVILVNRALTRFVSKRITTPLELLVSGVHELRDGRLDFRIEYNYNDEFKSVCDDFNEMAQYLYQMVTARQKDERSRKELIAGISHDLRTPLTSIKAYVEGIEKGVASNPEKQKRYLDTIKGKAEEMEHLLGQLFLFSKLDTGEFPLKVERVEVGEALGDFLTENNSEYKNKELTVTFTENSAKLFADIDVLQFRNVLHNILGNSIKYRTGDAAKSEIVYGEAGGSIVISITDDGPGVPDNSLDKLFDVFYREDDSRNEPSGGSGLGLAIARKIVEQLGGTIRAENVPDVGLSIIIALPKTGGAA